MPSYGTPQAGPVKATGGRGSAAWLTGTPLATTRISHFSPAGSTLVVVTAGCYPDLVLDDLVDESVLVSNTA
jgi:hypothetical protein